MPSAILVLGIASLLWGTFRNTLEIYEEQEIEISLAPPPEMMMQGDPMGGMGMPGGPEGGFPGEEGFPGEPGFEDPNFGGPPAMPPFMPGPPPEMQKVKQKILVSKEEPESRAVFEITIGGLALMDTGELQRTYTGAPPSLCPT